jgi:hypothetical protein
MVNTKGCHQLRNRQVNVGRVIAKARGTVHDLAAFLAR